MLDLAELGQGCLQSTLLDLAVDVLDVGAPLVSLRRCLSLLTTRLLLLGAHRLPAGGVALAVGGRGLASGGGGLLGRSLRRRGRSSRLGLGRHLGRRRSGHDRGGDLVGGRGKGGPRLGDCGLRRRSGSRSLGSRCRSRLLGLLGLGNLLLNSGLGFLAGSFLAGRHSSSGGVLSLSRLLSSGCTVGGGSGGLLSRLVLGGLQLLVDLVQILLGFGSLVSLLGCRGSGSRLLDIGSGSRSIVLGLLLILRLLSEVAEDVVEDEVAVGLLGEDESLREALVRLALVRDLTDDLDDDVGVGTLRIDVRNADLGVMEVEILDAVVDSLSTHGQPMRSYLI